MGHFGVAVLATSSSNTALQFFKDYMLIVVSNKYLAQTMGIIGLSLTKMVINETFELVKGHVKRNYITELEIPNTDKSFQWLLQWIAQHNDQMLHFTVNTAHKNIDLGYTFSKFNYEPCIGEHVIKYKGHSITVKRDRSSVMSAYDFSSKPFETLRLSILGRQRELLNEILEEARLNAMTLMESGTTLMLPFYNMWQPFGQPRTPRSMSTVILDDGVFENILKDVQNFVADQSWYLEKGIPYHRGYLLFGEPGCGKTSLIMALAGEIKYSVCVLNLSNERLTDDLLIQLMGEVPSKSLVLLEDIDAMFTKRKSENSEEEELQESKLVIGGSKVTLSGLLNALDGVMSSEGRILFMTTNHVDRLDPALIRSGRVDVKQYVGPCSDYQLSLMFKRFRPDSTVEDNKLFLSKIREKNKPVFPAYLQEFFLVHRHKELNDLFENLNNIWRDV